MSRTEESDIAREILKYLIENPEGKDTIEGVAHFWITSRRIQTMVERIQEALSSLVESGYLSETAVRDTAGRITARYYEVNRSRIEDIARIVSEKANSSGNS